MAPSDPPIFDPNISDGDATTKAMFPRPDAMNGGSFVRDVGSYVNFYEEAAKAQPPAIPQTYSYSRITYMPDANSSGYLSWPGIAPEALDKTVLENILPQLIIFMRVADVMRYSQYSDHPWRPGWKIELRNPRASPTKGQLQAIQEARHFILNCNIESTNSESRQRDAAGVSDFSRYLAAVTRDTLTYDGIAIWTDTDTSGRVTTFAPLNAGRIRLANREGYMGDPNKFAVLLDETGSVIRDFTREELTWYVRNPRTTPNVYGYGFSELEVGAKLIMGFQGALDLNISTFEKNAIPNGILLLEGGGWSYRQLEILTRIWQNLKKGNTKSWALPVIAVPEDGKLSILNMMDMKGTDVRYQDHMNMMAGAFCTLYAFPVNRLGYKISGRGPDSEPPPDGQGRLIDNDDPGLAPLLIHHENVIQEYFVASRWDDLKFSFSGKFPKEDAREYEARWNSMTWGERRAHTDERPLTEISPDWLKPLAEMLELTPGDQAFSGVFQTAATAMLMNKLGIQTGRDPEQVGSRMESKRDPAASEQHGHASGVRRDSAAESKS
jgi:hypothetical protein